MENMDTINLLRECNSGSRMAVTSIDEVSQHVTDPALQQLLQESKSHHEKLGDELHDLLAQYQADAKDPSPIAKGMSWLKTTAVLKMDDSDAAVADLITDGCDMGIKSLCKYQNQYSAAVSKAHSLCDRLISIEETLRKEMRPYL